MPAPATSVAPFQAVPAPEPRLDLSADDAFRAGAAVPARGDLLERPARVQSAPPRPSRSRSDVEPSLGSTGPAGPRLSGPAPKVPTQTTSAGFSSVYGDWTKPSGTEPEMFDDVRPARVPAPGTTAIPERSVRRRGSSRPAGDAPAPVAGPGTGPVGGRAAMRAERQAADAVRRKAEGHKGSAVAVLEDDEKRRPRHVLKGLVAMTVVALGVLGVYSYVSPQTEETAARTPSSVSTTGPEIPDVASLPELPSEPIVTSEPVAASPVRVPVTVLNSTDTTGLAAKVAGVIAGGGWETPEVGGYAAGDVAASTVFFTDGDENQRQAALQLIEMFPQLQGPTPRFFELPADLQAPGLVVVTTGDWQP